MFGVVSRDDCIETLLYGTDYHSHLGTQYGGMAVLGDEFVRQIHNISQSQFKSKFFEDCKLLKGDKGIGVISAFDEQPIYLNSHFGPFCIATNGLVENSEALAAELLAKGVSFSEVSRGPVNFTELIAKLITQGKNILDGIEQVSSKIKGACSILVLNKDGVYASRDRMGYSPLVIGKQPDAWAVTTETCGFPNTGFEVVKYLEPGEIVLLSKDGMVQKKPGGNTAQICSFLWIYTGFPASSYEGINVEIVRERSGRFLACRDKADNDIEADVVSGIPDSGSAHALGYAMESGVPFRRPLVKYTPGYGRSYTPPSQKTRDLIATMKLIPIKEIIADQRIVICDDSIVRGTQLKNFTIKKLWENGARQIHVRVACPPLLFPCKYSLSTRTTQELAARRAIRDLEGKDIDDVSAYINSTTPQYKKMVEWIARDIGVTSLKFQTVYDMVSAIGLPTERLCLHCWTGEGPEYKTKKGNKTCSACR